MRCILLATPIWVSMIQCLAVSTSCNTPIGGEAERSCGLGQNTVYTSRMLKQRKEDSDNPSSLLTVVAKSRSRAARVSVSVTAVPGLGQLQPTRIATGLGCCNVRNQTSDAFAPLDLSPADYVMSPLCGSLRADACHDPCTLCFCYFLAKRTKRLFGTQKS